MLDDQKKHLVKTIRKILSKGGNITVYGWIDSNHNPLTRGYGRTGRIIFVQRRKRIVGVSGDLVVFTRYISHPDQEKMQGKINFYPHPIEIREIIDILLECADLIVKKEVQSEVQSFNLDDENPGPATLDLNQLEKILQDTEVVVDQYDKLAERFAEAGKEHPENLVSTNVVGKILKDLEPPPCTLKELVSQGWLIAVKKEGKTKVGWYKAGEMLQARINGGKVEEPTDAVEKANFLIERKPVIEEKIAELEKELNFWKTQLNRVDKAEDLLRQLGEV